MRNALSHPMLVWLCLIVFGPGSTLLQNPLVVCSDSHGGVRLELVCDRNTLGECASACDPSDESPGRDHAGGHEPCEDRPVKADLVPIQASSRSFDLETIVVPALVAAFDVYRLDLPVLSPAQEVAPPEPVPDTVVRLRSVILVV